MTNEMKLEIAKIRADGYTVEVIVNHNRDKWLKYIKEYNALLVMYAWCGAPKHPSDFFTTEFKVTKDE